MICKHCGTEINTKNRETDGSVVCPGCGALYRRRVENRENIHQGYLHKNSASEAKIEQTKSAVHTFEKIDSNRPGIARDKYPQKPKRKKSKSKWIALALISLFVVSAIAIGGYMLSNRGNQNLTYVLIKKKTDRTPEFEFQYEYFPNGLLKATEQYIDEDCIIRVDYHYNYDVNGNPTRVWTTYSENDKTGRTTLSVDDFDIYKLEKLGEFEMDKVILRDLRADIKNEYSGDRLVGVKLYNEVIFGMPINDYFNSRDYFDSSTSKPGFMDTIMYAENRLLATLVDTPFYDNITITNHGSTVKKANGEVTYSCYVIYNYTKNESVITKNNNEKRTATTTYTYNQNSKTWTRRFESENITVYNSKGYLVSMSERKSEINEEPYFQSVTFMQLDGHGKDVTLRGTVVESSDSELVGEVVSDYIYNSSGDLIEQVDYLKYASLVNHVSEGRIEVQYVMLSTLIPEKVKYYDRNGNINKEISYTLADNSTEEYYVSETTEYTYQEIHMEKSA